MAKRLCWRQSSKRMRQRYSENNGELRSTIGKRGTSARVTRQHRGQSKVQRHGVLREAQTIRTIAV